MTSIQKIEGWLIKQGYTLHFGRTDQVNRDPNVVTITSTLSRKPKIYSLLHECGHVILYNSSDYLKKYKSVDIGDNQDQRHAKSLIFRYKKLAEEMEAWNEGYKLAQKLGIKISKVAYDTYAAPWIHSYIRAVADTKESYHKWKSSEHKQKPKKKR